MEAIDGLFAFIVSTRSTLQLLVVDGPLLTGLFSMPDVPDPLQYFRPDLTLRDTGDGEGLPSEAHRERSDHVLRRTRHVGAGTDLKPARGLGADLVYLLGQDGHADPQ